MKKVKNKQHQVQKSRKAKHQPNKQSENSRKGISYAKKPTLTSALNQPRREQFWDVIEAINNEQAKDLALFQGMRKELAGIKKWYGEKPDHPYRLARVLLYEALLPFEVELTSNQRLETYDKDSIVAAGKLLFEAEGMKGMHDYLLWSFVPKSCKRIIDELWNGIGDWRN
ncbi:hypothetical protein Cri9333_0357 [Crinalium epipsammum PCC 9333]|uniref:Uncharacterized protein n=1 Tax=Crinalium epipsammum PCC 9333 TaxID=1173022 RepID=K9VV24_9CYAN|nr:hypothetical protein [Crinalium epipsammum]AFZ11337.1 hypothetical protein Cri9333_0357 [Crinalium epipsammum PCC 9333]